MVDCGLHRKTWALVLATTAALCWRQQSSCWMRDNNKPDAGSFHGAAGGTDLWQHNGRADSFPCGRASPGSVSGWLNTAYLSGSALAGMLAIFAVQHWTKASAAALLAGITIAPALVLQALSGDEYVPRPAREMFQLRQLSKEIWTLLTTRKSLLGSWYLSCGRGICGANLFSGLGHEYGASDNQVAWITGAGVAIACSAGRCWRVDVQPLEPEDAGVVPGVASAVATLTMAFGPRTLWIFFGGVLFYNLMAGSTTRR